MSYTKEQHEHLWHAYRIMLITGCAADEALAEVEQEERLVTETPLADILRGAKERGPWIDEAAMFDHAPFTAADSVRPERLWGGPYVE